MEIERNRTVKDTIRLTKIDVKEGYNIYIEIPEKINQVNYCENKLILVDLQGIKTEIEIKVKSKDGNNKKA
jgi:hypothetical protein